MTIEFLKKIPIFSDLTQEDLERLCNSTDEIKLKNGDVLFNEGDVADSAYVIKKGQLEIFKLSGNQQILLAIRETGDFIGEVALFQDTSRTASIKAKTDVTLIEVKKAVFDELISVSRSASRSIFRTILSRLRSTETLLRERDKLAQLGTLSAGLAHELNNPSAAIARGVNILNELIEDIINLQIKLTELNLSSEDVNNLIGVISNLKIKAIEPQIFDPLVKSDLEYEMENTLNELKIDNPWEFAPLLVEASFSPTDIINFFPHLQPNQKQTIIMWITKIYSIMSVRNEVSEGTDRVTSIIKALKGYSYLDQGPVQSIDIHEGIDNTLLILRSRIKRGIVIKRDFGENIPKIQAFGSELNQVWTNILVNSLDALEETDRIKDGSAVIKVRTSLKNNWLLVEIEDNGPGIPKNIVKRIFDPFFTTKEPGKGTGLGLDISYNIIVEKHRGDIKVFSKPGSTCFRIYLPVDITKAEGTSPFDEYRLVDDKKLLYLLKISKTVAVFGISDNQEKASYTVPKFLQSKGYEIIGVDKDNKEFLGNEVYKSLSEINKPIDIVLIFKESDETPKIVSEAINTNVKAVWMQEGIINEYAAMMAKDAGIDVVMDRCMRSTFKRLIEK
ncbi:MAG: Sensor histidine kinase TmoS [Candidatus Heimdallarchaeota archaeon LC_3]|nr:MAG: Sensor histidine kinase TmoS [Candidatus Heimdallarchaeota archaeon LC_3]